ncbi:hypothetical protein PROFUN_08453 [Planoprotostelium fungivorum]|uniref:Uncharacterized protein n=1 Tax=Planoprotostelium fungivorum TaxID=1890364 RepID=A0A2P6N1U2_9EUKA|nr:hypothetical protein PROFUN_08453 [Planoprotostelium fungivorum]
MGCNGIVARATKGSHICPLLVKVHSLRANLKFNQGEESQCVHKKVDTPSVASSSPQENRDE